MAERVRITDVSPRDGLQNEPLRADGSSIPTEDKARLVRALSLTGVDEIEVTSFVSPRWVPQLGDAAELCKLVTRSKPLGLSMSALVPNEKGMQALLAANESVGMKLIDKASVFAAASETFSRKNTNATIAETIERFRPIVPTARDHGLAVRGYVSCIIACPFEGVVTPEAVLAVCKQLEELGVDEIDLGDTIGAGCTETMAALLACVTSEIDPARLVLHLHDTFGRAAECVRVALAMGIRSFDGSAAGLGGCPYASTETSRAPGNIATNLLVRTIHDAGYETGVDLEKLAEASRVAQEITAGAAGVIRTETIERDGRSIAVVLLDRPEKRNALTPDMLAALCTALEEAPKTHDAVVLAGEGKLFCAGFDLSLCKDDPSGETMRKLLTRLSRACTIMRRTEKPVVIAAHGAAIAGGCALLGGGDVVVSDIHAKLGYPVTKIGVSPAVSAPFLSYNVTTGTSREMLLVPELVSGEAAHAKSLVHELVDLREDVRDKAISIAANLADKPSHAYAATKSLLNQLEGTDDGEAFRLALDASLALTGGEEEQRLLAQLDL